MALRQGPLRVPLPRFDGRVTTPLIRDRGLEPASFGEVLTRFAGLVSRARASRSSTGGRLMDEDYYALSKLARTVLETNDLDHRRDLRRRRRRGHDAARAGARHLPRRRAGEGDPGRRSRRGAGGADPASPAAQGRRRAARGSSSSIRGVRGCGTSPSTSSAVPGDEACVRRGAAVAPPMVEAVANALREAGDAGVVIAGPRLADHPQSGDRRGRWPSDTGQGSPT